MLHRWRRLTPPRRAALRWALAAVTVVRLCLRFFPLRVWERLAGRLGSSRTSAPGAHTAQDVVWAVGRASRVVPRATCLTQALAAHILLARSGHRSRLKIGVARTSGRGLRAHAWLESDGAVLLGGSCNEAYTPLNGPCAGGADLFMGVPGQGRNRGCPVFDVPSQDRQFTMEAQ